MDRIGPEITLGASAPGAFNKGGLSCHAPSTKGNRGVPVMPAMDGRSP